jgi:hypothetical protein
MDGSCALNCVFLPKNATMINLGVPIDTPNGAVIGWLDDYLYPVLDYIKVLYLADVSGDDSVENVHIKKSSGLYVPLQNLLQLIDKVHETKAIQNNLSPNARKWIQTPDYKAHWKELRLNNLACACTLKLNSF